jgi:hypothetical protein
MARILKYRFIPGQEEHVRVMLEEREGESGLFLYWQVRTDYPCEGF